MSEQLVLGNRVPKVGQSEAGIRKLAALAALEKPAVDDTEITDASLQPIGGLTRLGELDLRGTRVSDAGLSRLARLERLETLALGRTRVTDAGLAHLAGCPGSEPSIWPTPRSATPPSRRSLAWSGSPSSTWLGRRCRRRASTSFAVLFPAARWKWAAE